MLAFKNALPATSLFTFLNRPSVAPARHHMIRCPSIFNLDLSPDTDPVLLSLTSFLNSFPRPPGLTLLPLGSVCFCAGFSAQ